MEISPVFSQEVEASPACDTQVSDGYPPENQRSCPFMAEPDFLNRSLVQP